MLDKDQTVEKFKKIMFEFTGIEVKENIPTIDYNDSKSPTNPGFVEKILSDKVKVNIFYSFIKSNIDNIEYRVENINIIKDTLVHSQKGILKVVFFRNNRYEVSASIGIKDIHNSDYEFKLVYYFERSGVLSDFSIIRICKNTFKTLEVTVDYFNEYIKKNLLNYNKQAEDIIPNYNITSVIDFTDPTILDALKLIEITEY